MIKVDKVRVDFPWVKPQKYWMQHIPQCNSKAYIFQAPHLQFETHFFLKKRRPIVDKHDQIINKT